MITTFGERIKTGIRLSRLFKVYSLNWELSCPFKVVLVCLSLLSIVIVNIAKSSTGRKEMISSPGYSPSQGEVKEGEEAETVEEHHILNCSPCCVNFAFLYHTGLSTCPWVALLRLVWTLPYQSIIKKMTTHRTISVILPNNPSLCQVDKKLTST